MAATDVEICNLALDIVSVTNKVISIAAPTSKEERACARWYATARDIVLRRFPWPFAKGFAILTSIPSATETNLVWPFLYSVPADWLKSRRIFLEGEERAPRDRHPFNTFLNSAGSAYIIGADIDGACLEYTRTFSTNGRVAMIPATAVDAIAALLAMKIVKPLSLDAALIKEAKGLFDIAVAEAFAENSDEQQFDPQPDAPWITARE